MVICRFLDFLDGPMVEVTQPYPNILKYENKLYEIDKDFQRSFVLDRVCLINATQEGLYTMFYDDGTVNETWHDRWKPDLKTLVAMGKQRKLIGEGSILAPLLHSAELMLAGCATMGDSPDARLQRKAGLLEIALLSAMELMDMEAEDANMQLAISGQ